MFGFDVKVIDETKAVEKAVEKASYRNLGHAAASIRKAAMKLIRRSKRPSKPGKPPRTRKGALRRAILFDVDEHQLSAFIGPAESRVGTAGEAHEFGGDYMGADFPARPFMGPALEEAAPRMLDSWEGSLGGDDVERMSESILTSGLD